MTRHGGVLIQHATNARRTILSISCLNILPSGLFRFGLKLHKLCLKEFKVLMCKRRFSLMTTHTIPFNPPPSPTVFETNQCLSPVDYMPTVLWPYLLHLKSFGDLVLKYTRGMHLHQLRDTFSQRHSWVQGYWGNFKGPSTPHARKKPHAQQSHVNNIGVPCDRLTIARRFLAIWFQQWTQTSSTYYVVSLFA